MRILADVILFSYIDSRIGIVIQARSLNVIKPSLAICVSFGFSSTSTSTHSEPLLFPLPARSVHTAHTYCRTNGFPFQNKSLH